MSIIIGFVTRQCGIIASDGRQFGSARFENERLIEKAKIINESFNKTFSLNDGKIIGASAGLTTFQEKRISEHLEELIKEKWDENISIDEIIRNTIESLKTRLKKIENTEVLFEHRKVDIILISSKKLGLLIYSIRLLPNRDKQEIHIEFDVIPTNKKTQGIVYWKLFGDDSAQSSSIKYFDRVFKTINNTGRPFLIATIKKSISAGIAKADIHPFGDDQSCGGQIFTREII